jgi:hypothetical protein
MSGADAGREATYAAEDDAFGGTELDDEVGLGRLAAIAAGIAAGEWWRSCGAPAVSVVAARTGARSSSARPAADGAGVRIAAEQCNLGTLTHELAHALAGVERGHDARFRAAHVDVVAMAVDAAHAAALRGSYRDHGVPAGRRAWPAPVRVTGEGFAVVP